MLFTVLGMIAVCIVSIYLIVAGYGFGVLGGIFADKTATIVGVVLILIGIGGIAGCIYFSPFKVTFGAA